MVKQKKIWVFALVFCVFSSIIAQQKTKPNVLFIAIDDLKPTLGAYGDKNAITPNIDKLALKGATFLNNHTQQAVCAPSRVSLLTGKRPDYTKVRDLKTQMRDKNPNIVTIPQYFKSKGYTTAGTGKIFDPRSVDKMVDKPSWSIPYIREHSIEYPTEYGKPKFGYYQNKEIKEKIRVLTQEAKAKGIKNINAHVMKQFKPPVEMSDVPDEAYTDGAIAKHALSLLNTLAKDAETPFFLAVGFKRPHLPFVAPKKYWDLYDRNQFSLAPYQKKVKNGTSYAYHSSGELRSYVSPDFDYKINDEGLLDLDPARQKELIHGYYACTSFVDYQIGSILDALREKGLDKNTIVVVWGDHGWHLGDHGMWNKHSNFEQATRSPMIIYSPFNDKEVKVNSPTEFVDVFPTLCEMTGLDTPDNLDGKSLVPVIKEDQYRVKRFAVSQWHKKNATGYSFRADQYRYTVWVGNGKKSTDAFTDNDIVGQELYDYWNDPFETTNQIGNINFKATEKEMISYANSYFNDEKAKVKRGSQTDKTIGEVLRKKYKKSNFKLGATLGYTQLGGQVEELFLEDFTYCTSRNFAKQSYVHPEPGVWQWDRIEDFIEFGNKNKVELRLHSPVSPQASRWAKADHRTAEELDKNMIEFMTTLCMKINNEDAVKWMDVVNETIERDGSWFGTKPGVKEWENPWVTIGNDENGYPLYISKAFEISNKYAPNISQVFNQHGGMEPVMWEKVKETITYLRKQGYRIDGLGWQSHLKEYSRVVDDPKNLVYLSNLIDWAHENQLDFHITEFDYHLKTGTNTPDNYKKQAAAYKTILDIVLEKRKSGVVTVNFWGLVDSEDGKNRHRFLYDENRMKKPCYNAVVEALIEGSN